MVARHRHLPSVATAYPLRCHHRHHRHHLHHLHLLRLQAVHAFPSVRIYRGSIHAYEPYEFGREENILWLHLVKLAAEVVISTLKELCANDGAGRTPDGISCRRGWVGAAHSAADAPRPRVGAGPTTTASRSRCRSRTSRRT